jgi:hypothetical protein
MRSNEDRYLAALAHVATCEDCQKWLEEVTDGS